MGLRYSGTNPEVMCGIRNCSCYRAIRLLECGMKVVENLLSRVMIVNKIQFGFISDKGRIDAVFILRRLL